MEYFQLSAVTSTDVLATVLEEMPPFPERDSSILAKLKKKKPATKDIEAQENRTEKTPRPVPQISNSHITIGEKVGVRLIQGKGALM